MRNLPANRRQSPKLGPGFWFTITTLLLSVGYITVKPVSGAGYGDPHFTANRTTITHLMQWRFEDIAAECERFLAPYGYGGVQVSPVNEHAVLQNRPWYELYQPVSYRLISRSGDEKAFTDMVTRCNRVGVRIYVDIVLNHMTGGQAGSGSAGAHYDGNNLQYPGVPFGPNDFHGHESCGTGDLEIHNYDNANEARNCRLSGLRDLKQSSDYVRSKQIEFLNHLIDIGVAGFRSDASKHMWPGDLEAIYSKLHNLNTKYFPAGSRPFIYHEVIDFGGSAGIHSTEYAPKLGRAIEFRYARELSRVVRGRNAMKYLQNFGEKWSMIGGNNALVMIDSHDMQRGHTGTLSENINYFEPRLLKVATAFMLAWPYGVPRVMSSYRWQRSIENGVDKNDWMGPPGNNGAITPVRPQPDMTCNSEWICEHRWQQIYNMVRWRNVAGNEPMSNWWSGSDYQIAFSRGSRAWIAINMQSGKDLHARIHTGLPHGTYCDLVSGSLSGSKCTGAKIVVDNEGKADVQIAANAEDPFIAIHVDAKIN